MGTRWKRCRTVQAGVGAASSRAATKARAGTPSACRARPCMRWRSTRSIRGRCTPVRIPRASSRRRTAARTGATRASKVRTITGLTLDPSNTDIVYATTSNGREASSRTRTGAAAAAGEPSTPALRHCGPAHEFSTALALDPRNPATIYVATNGDFSPGEGAGVSKSLDGGRSWRSTNAGLNGARVSALALAPGSPGTAYAAVVGRGVFKRADGRWRAVNTGLTNSSVVTAVAVDPQDPATVYAGAARRHLQEHERRRELAGFIHADLPRRPDTFRAGARGRPATPGDRLCDHRQS